MTENSSQSRSGLTCVATQGLLGKFAGLVDLMLLSEWHEILWTRDYPEEGEVVQPPVHLEAA